MQDREIPLTVLAPSGGRSGRGGTPLRSKHTPRRLLFLVAAVVLAVAAQPASAIKVCTYNALNFPNDYSARVDAFRLVVDESELLRGLSRLSTSGPGRGSPASSLTCHRQEDLME